MGGGQGRWGRVQEVGGGGGGRNFLPAAADCVLTSVGGERPVTGVDV